MMEAWLSQTPCLVNENCVVTREHIMRSGGGLYFANYADFEGALNYFLNNDEMRRRMGEDGRKYVLNNFSWETIIQKYLNEVFAR
jgi:glycosyltransferase involved in cell wall biosynthesis